MGIFICAKCGCVDNTATSEYWNIVTKIAPDAEWDDSLVPYKWKPLCSECCKIEFDESGNHARYVPGEWHGKFYHPTQKPVALLEYPIRTYTDEGDTIMDNCMGSGTTGVACINTGRNFIGYEKEKKNGTGKPNIQYGLHGIHAVHPRQTFRAGHSRPAIRT